MQPHQEVVRQLFETYVTSPNRAAAWNLDLDFPQLPLSEAGTPKFDICVKFVKAIHEANTPKAWAEIANELSLAAKTEKDNEIMMWGTLGIIKTGLYQTLSNAYTYLVSHDEVAKALKEIPHVNYLYDTTLSEQELKQFEEATLAVKTKSPCDAFTKTNKIATSTSSITVALAIPTAPPLITASSQPLNKGSQVLWTDIARTKAPKPAPAIQEEKSLRKRKHKRH